MVKLMPRVYTRATCYLCARPLDGDSTSEHVVPRQLYPSKPLPNDMLTLPAHRACNESTQPDEDVFRDFVAAAIPEGSPATPLWETAWRGLNKERAAGKKRAFFAGLVERDDLLHVTIDEPRANWVLAKMVKGFFVQETNTILAPADVRWAFFKVDRTRLPPLDALSRYAEAHDVVRARWGQAEDEPVATHWILGVLGVHFFSILTIPRTRSLRVKARGAEPLVWPRPPRRSQYQSRAG